MNKEPMIFDEEVDRKDNLSLQITAEARPEKNTWKVWAGDAILIDVDLSEKEIHIDVGALEDSNFSLTMGR